MGDSRHLTLRLLGGSLHNEVRVFDRNLIRSGIVIDMVDPEADQVGYARTILLQDGNEALGEPYVVREIPSELKSEVRFVMLAYGLSDDELSKLLEQL